MNERGRWPSLFGVKRVPKAQRALPVSKKRRASRKSYHFLNSRLSIVWLFLLLLYGTLFAPRSLLARNESVDQTLKPTMCAGWANADAARTIEALRSSSYQDFRESDSALYRFQPARNGHFGESTSESTVHCRQFSLEGIDKNQEVETAGLVLSLAALAPEAGADVLVLERSYDDGRSWHTLGTIPIQGEVSNSQHEGYWRFALPAGTTKDDLQHLHIRLNYVAADEFSATSVSLDGMAIEVTLKKLPKESFLDTLFSTTEQPTVLIDQKSIQDIEILDPDGRVLDIPVVSTVEGGKTKITLAQKGVLRPGTYIVRTKSKKFFRTVVEEQAFSFGLANLNPTKAVYEPGDLASLAVGVLDPKGKTICHAQLTLRVTKPDGSIAILSTTDGSIAGSSECGADSLTSLPDYSAHLVPKEEGTYRTQLEILTDRGIERVESSFDVKSDIPYRIERVAPTRINPKVPYLSRIKIVPERDYQGTVEETLPKDFLVSGITPQASVTAAGEQQKILWNVDWKAGQSYELFYSFDAPDISPTLFTLGPTKFVDYQEPRVWTVASDELVRRENPDLEFEPVAVSDADFAPQHDTLVTPTKNVFKGGENAHIKAFKKGFKVPSEKLKKGLEAARPLSVENVEILGPDNLEPSVFHVTEQFQRAGKELELLHLVPKRTFRPGKYKIVTTLSDGVNTVKEEQTFMWGVLVVNTEKSVYQPNETVKFGMGAVNSGGHTVCEAPMTLTIIPPAGAPVILSSDDGSIQYSPECGPITVTNTSDYSATYLAQGAGDYQLSLTAVIEEQPYTITDTLYVRDEIAFDIKRNAPSRLYPLTDYGVTFTVVPKEAYKGDFEELVPATYDVIEIGQGGVVSSADDQAKLLRWSVDWEARKSYELTYRMDPEDISPALFLLGKAKVGNFEEYRQWHIASDAVGGSGSGVRLKTVGFELQSLTAGHELNGSNGAPAIDTALKRSGGASLETLVSGSAATEFAILDYSNSVNVSDDLYARVYINITTAPAAETRILCFVDFGTTYQACIRMNTDRTLELWNEEDGPTLIGSASSALAIGTWYRVELRYDTTDGAGTNDEIEGRIDGVVFATNIGGTLADHGNGALGIHVGIVTATTAEFNFDDIAINDDNGGSDQNWPGEGKVVHLRPSSSVNGCDAGTYTNVRDDPVGTPDDNTTKIVCDVVNDYLEVSLDDTSTAGITAGDTVKLAHAGYRFTGADALASFAFTAGARIPTGNTIETVTITETTSTWQSNAIDYPWNYQVTYFDQTTTADGDPITTADLDSAVIRITATDVTPNVWLSTIWMVVEYVPAEGGRMWSTGFELQSVAALMENLDAGGSPVIDTSGVDHSGAAAVRIQGFSSGVAEYVGQYFDSATSDGPYFFRTYLRITTAPSADNTIIRLMDNGANLRAAIKLTSSRTLLLFNESSQVGSASTALSTGTWYRIEIKFDSRGLAGADILEARVGGDVFATSSSQTFTTGIMRFWAGANLWSTPETQTAGDWYFDDIAVNKGIGSTQNGYPGPGSMIYIRPSAAGDNSGWTANLGCAAADWSCVDEIPPNTTDAVASSTINAIEDYNITDTSGAGFPANSTVTLVQLGVRFNNSTTTQSDFVVRMKDAASAPAIEGDTEFVTSTTWRTNDELSTYNPYSLTAYTRPYQNTSWTLAQIDSTQVGLRLTRDGGTNQIQVTAMWLLVEYIPPINVTGTCDAFDQTTDCGDTGTVRMAINEQLTAATQATVSGAWTISNAPQPDLFDFVTIYIEGAANTDEAVAVGEYDGSGNITGVALYKEHLTVGSDDNQSLTNTELGKYDNSVSGSEDIFHDVDSSNNLTVDANGSSAQEELYISTGNTHAPNGNVTTFAVEIDGTLTAGSSTITIQGNGTPFVVDGTLTTPGVFTAGTSIVVYTHATSATIGPTTYNILQTNGTGTYTASASTDDFERAGPGLGTSWIDNLQGDPQIYGSSDLGGALAGNNTATWATPVGADQYSEIVVAALSTTDEVQTCVRLSNGGSDAYCYTSDSDGSATDVYKLVGGVYTSLDPGNLVPASIVGDTMRLEVIGTTIKAYLNNVLKLQVTDSSVGTPAAPAAKLFGTTSRIESWRGGAVLATNSDVTVSQGTLALGNYDLTVLGGDITTHGSLSQNSTTMTTLGATGTVGGSGASTSFGHFHVGGTTGTVTTTAGQNFTVQGKLWINDTSGTNTFNASSYTITLSGSGQPLNIGAGEAFTASTSTILHTGTSATTILEETYYNIHFKPTSGSPTYTLATTTGKTITASGDWIVGNGTNAVTVNWETNDPTLDVSGNFTLDASTTWTKSSSATLTFKTAGTKTLTDNNSTKQNLGTIAIGDGAVAKVINLGTSVLASKVTITSASTFSHNGSNTMELNSTSAEPFIVNSGSTFTPSTGTVRFSSTVALDVRDTTYYNLELRPNAAGGPTYTLGNAASDTINVTNNLTIGDGTNAVTVAGDLTHTLDVDGSVTINTGATLNATNITTFRVGGSWTKNGTFTHGSQTVTLDTTTTATITGATTFNNLSTTTAGKILQFAASTTFTFDGTFTVGGTSGNLIHIHSTTPGTQWLADFNVAQSSMTYAHISDSGCAVGSLNVTLDTTATDDGGNDYTCWKFQVTLSGTVYSDEGVTAIGNPPCDGIDGRIRIRVNGTTQNVTTSCAAANSTYSKVISQPLAGDVITVYVDEQTANAVTITRYNAQNVTGLDLYQNRIILRHEDAGPITNANLELWDAGDEVETVDGDLGFDVVTSNLTVSNTRELHINSGKTFTPGGTLTTNATSTASGVGGDVHNLGTLTMAANALSVGGDYTNTGTLSLSAGHTTTFTATGSGFTVTPGSSSFQNVIFNGSAGVWSPATGQTLTAANDLTMTAGTLNSATGTGNVTVNGNVACGASCGTITLTSGTFLQSVTVAKNFGTSVAGTTAWTFQSLTFTGTSDIITTSTTGSGDITVNTLLTVSASTTLNAGNRVWILAGTGSSFTMSGTFTASTSTVRFTGNGATNVNALSGANAYNNLELKPPGTQTHTLNAGTLEINGDLVVGTGTVGQTVTVQWETNDPAINLAGNMTLNSPSTWTKSSTATLTFDGTTAKTFTDSNATKQDIGFVTVNKTDTVAPSTNNKITLASSMTVSTMTIDGAITSPDTLNLGSSGYILILQGAVQNPLTVSGTLTPGTSTVRYRGVWTDGRVNVTTTTYNSIDFASSAAEIYLLTGNLTGANALTGNLTISSSTTALDASTFNYNIELTTGNWTNNRSSTAFTARNGEVIMRGTSASIGGTQLTTFYKLTVSNSGGNAVVTAVGTVNNALTVDTTDTLTINSSLTSNTVGSVVINGTINGTGYLIVKNSDLGTGGTLTANVRFQRFATMVARTAPNGYGGGVDIVSDGTVGTSVTAGTAAGQTIDIAGSVVIDCLCDLLGALGVTLNASTYNPNINIGGDLVLVDYFPLVAFNDNTLYMGNGTWTVTGNVNITGAIAGGIFSPGNSTLKMNGAGANTITLGDINFEFYHLEVVAGTKSFVEASPAIGGNMTISGGTFSAPTGTFTVRQGWNNSGGTFTHNSGTVQFSSTAGGRTLAGTMTGASKFYNAIFTGNSSGAWSLNAAAEIANDLTMTTGTLSGTNNLTVNGNVSGDYTGIITLTGGTFELRVAAGKNFGNSSLVSQTWTFNNLMFSNSSGSPVTVTVTSLTVMTHKVTGVLSIGRADDTAATTLSAAAQWDLAGTGAPLSLLASPAAGFTPNTSSFRYTGDGAVTVTRVTYYALNLVPTITADQTYTMASGGSWTINNNFLVRATKSTAGTATLSVNMGGATTVTETTTISGVTNGASILNTTSLNNYSLTTKKLDVANGGAGGTLTANGSTITLTATSGILFKLTGTFTPGTSTVIMNPDANHNTANNELTSGAITFYNLQLTPSVTAGRTYSFGSGALTITNNFDINPTGSAFLLTVNMGADITASGTTTISRTGLPTSLLETTVTNYTLTTGSLNVSVGGTLTANASNIILTGTGTPLTLTGTFTYGTSAVRYTGNGATNILALSGSAGSNGYYNLEVKPAGAATHSFQAGTTRTNNNLVVGDGTNAGIASTVNSPTINVINDLTVNASGTLSGAGTGTMTVNGHVTGAGTITLTGGTLEQAVAAAKNFGPTTASSTWTFNNLTMSSTSLAPTITAQACTTCTVSITGTFLVSKTGMAGTGLTFAAAGNTYTLSNSNSAKPFNVDQVAGVLTANTSTFNYTGDNDAADVTIENVTYYNLKYGGSVAENYDAEGAVSMTVTNDLTPTSSGTLIGTDSWTVNRHATGTGTINLTGGTFEQAVAGAANFGPTTASSTWTFVNLTLSSTSGAPAITAQACTTCTVTVTGTFVVSKTGMAGTGLTFAAGSNTYTLSNTNNANPFDVDQVAGVLTANTSTFNYTGDCDTACDVVIENVTYYNLTVGGSVAENYDAEGAVSMTVTNDLTPTSSGTLIGTDSWTVNRHATGTGTINLTGGTFEQAVAGAANFGPTTASSTWTFVNLTLSSTSGAPTITAQSCTTCTINVTGTFLVSKTGMAGTGLTLIASGNTYTLSSSNNTKPFNVDQVAGALTANTSMFNFTGNATAADVTIENVSYNNLTVGGGSAENYVLEGPITTSGDVTVNASGTLTDGVDNLTVNGGDVTGDGTITFTGTTTVTMDAAGNFGGNTAWTFFNLTFGDGVGATTTTTTGTGGITVNGDLTIAAGPQTLDAKGKTWTLAGTDGVPFNINGTFDDSTNTSTFVYTGNNSAGNTTITGSAAYHSLNINNASEIYVLGGAVTLSGDFSGNAGTLSEDTDNMTVNGGDFQGSAIVTFSGSTTVLLDGAGFFGSGSAGWTFANLTFGDGTGAATSTANGTGGITVNADLTIAANQTLDAKGKTWTLAGTDGTPFTINGTLDDTTNTSTFAFTGDCNVSCNTTIPASAGYHQVTLNNGTETFNLGGNVTLSGNATVTAGILSETVDSMTVAGDITGAGTVTFSGGTVEQRVAANQSFGSSSGSNNWTLNNLTFSNSSAADRTITTSATGTGQIIVSGTLTVARSSGDTNATILNNETNDRIVDANGSVVINSLGTLQASSTAAFNVSGHWTNNGTFTANSGTVTIDGTSFGQQTLSGTMTGVNGTFNNLTITNSSGTDPDTSPSVVFAAAADTAATFAATAGAGNNVKLRFANTPTAYTFTAINLSGTNDTSRVFLRSSTTGTQSVFNAGAGARTVTYANVRDSNACGSTGGEIDASDGTNIDAIGNSCWKINTLTITISDSTVGFGSCTPSAARFADGVGDGEPTDAADAHTITVATSARGGYSLTVTGPTLTSGAETIDALPYSATASSPGTEQFGLRVLKNLGQGTVTAPYNTSNWAHGATTATREIASHTTNASDTEYGLRYICNITNTTAAASYSTNMTYIVTGTY